MKYELIQKEKIDRACELIWESKTKTYTDISKLDEAYKILMENRTQCNVQPEGK